MQLSPSTNIHFGWSQSQHRAIRQGAFKQPQLSEPLKRYLQEQAQAIGTVDDDQDISVKGIHHFLHLGDQRNQFVPQSTWQEVDKDFSPEHKNQSIPPIPSGKNVIDAVQEAYENLIQAFKKVENGDPLKSRGSVKTAINKAMGELTHYAGDLTMPLHETSHYTWPTESAHGLLGADMHSFLELAEYGLDYAEVAQGNKAPSQTAPIKRSNLESVLMQHVRQAYRAIFEIVDIQRRMSQPAALKNPSPYYAQLRGIIKEQLTKSQSLVASLTQSAWSEAISSKKTPLTLSYYQKTNAPTVQHPRVC